MRYSQYTIHKVTRDHDNHFPHGQIPVDRIINQPNYHIFLLFGMFCSVYKCYIASYIVNDDTFAHPSDRQIRFPFMIGPYVYK